MPFKIIATKSLIVFTNHNTTYRTNIAPWFSGYGRIPNEIYLRKLTHTYVVMNSKVALICFYLRIFTIVPTVFNFIRRYNKVRVIYYLFCLNRRRIEFIKKGATHTDILL